MVYTTYFMVIWRMVYVEIVLPCFTPISTIQIPPCRWWNRHFFPGEVLMFCMGPSDHCDSEASLGAWARTNSLWRVWLGKSSNWRNFHEANMFGFFVGWCSSYKPPLRDVFFVDFQWPSLITGGYTLWPTIRVCYRKSFRKRWIFWIMEGGQKNHSHVKVPKGRHQNGSFNREDEDHLNCWNWGVAVSENTI